MNKPDTARMPQRPQEYIIELIEIVREDEEKNASADPDQDADIIELDDAIEDPVPEAESRVFLVDRSRDEAADVDVQPAANLVEQPSPTTCDAAGTASVAEQEAPTAPCCDTAVAEKAESGDAPVPEQTSVPVSQPVVPVDLASDRDEALLERLRVLEERLAMADRQNEALRLRLEALEQRMAERLDREGQELALIEERTAALEAVPQISLDSVQAAMDSLSGQLNASLDAMQSNLDAVQRELHAEATVAALATQLEPVIDKAAAQAAARVIREEIARMVAQA